MKPLRSNAILTILPSKERAALFGGADAPANCAPIAGRRGPPPQPARLRTDPSFARRPWRPDHQTMALVHHSDTMSVNFTMMDKCILFIRILNHELTLWFIGGYSGH